MNEIKAHITKILSIGLPGQSSQQNMMPEGRNLNPENQAKPRNSAVLILLFRKDNTIYFPLIRRQKYDGAHSGQMAFPGGKQESNETLMQTALRESYEEIGVDPDQVQVLGTLSDLYIPITNMLVKPYLAITNNDLKFKTDPIEVDKVHTIKLADIKNSQHKKIEKWIIRGQEVKVPFYLLDDQKVWGATAMMLSELESLLNDFFFSES